MSAHGFTLGDVPAWFWAGFAIAVYAVLLLGRRR